MKWGSIRKGAITRHDTNPTPSLYLIFFYFGYGVECIWRWSIFKTAPFSPPSFSRHLCNHQVQTFPTPTIQQHQGSHLAANVHSNHHNTRPPFSSSPLSFHQSWSTPTTPNPTHTQPPPSTLTNWECWDIEFCPNTTQNVKTEVKPNKNKPTNWHLASNQWICHPPAKWSHSIFKKWDTYGTLSSIPLLTNPQTPNPSPTQISSSCRIPWTIIIHCQKNEW